MNLQRSVFLALMMGCSSLAMAQQAAPAQPIVLGNSYQSIETFCRDWAGALKVAAAMETAWALQQKDPQAKVLPKPQTKSCKQALVTGVYVSKEFTYRLIPVAMNVTIYSVDDAQAGGVRMGKVYVISARMPTERF